MNTTKGDVLQMEEVETLIPLQETEIIIKKGGKEEKLRKNEGMKAAL